MKIIKSMLLLFVALQSHTPTFGQLAYSLLSEKGGHTLFQIMR